MNPNTEQNSSLEKAFCQAICNELEDAIRKIRHCVDQLSEDQIWWRPSESMNSIANLILHLCGNVRQWIIAGLGGVADHRNRPQEFAQRERISTADLMNMLDTLAAEVKQVLQSVSDDQWVRKRNIQGFDVSGVQAVIESIAHFRGHTQEITHMTRIQLGDAYQFDFVPGPDQNGGAAN